MTHRVMSIIMIEWSNFYRDFDLEVHTLYLDPMSQMIFPCHIKEQRAVVHNGDDLMQKAMAENGNLLSELILKKEIIEFHFQRQGPKLKLR